MTKQFDGSTAEKAMNIIALALDISRLSDRYEITATYIGNAKSLRIHINEKDNLSNWLYNEHLYLDGPRQAVMHTLDLIETEMVQLFRPLINNEDIEWKKYE